jgi:hypothetical protein
MAEEEGVEPTKDAARLSPDLKSGHPTGDVALPSMTLALSQGSVNGRRHSAFGHPQAWNGYFTV